MYTNDERNAFERILNTFGEYIKSSRMIALAESDKLGYLLFSIDTFGGIASEAMVIESPEHLCALLMREIACDVLEGLPHTDLNLPASSDEERALILERLKPYLDQLPEYRHLFARIFEE